MSVSISQMSQLEGAKCLDDNWTGLKDRAERKKRQTRLNVRAHRKRKAEARAMIVKREHHVQPREHQISPSTVAGEMLIFAISAGNFKPLSFDPLKSEFPLSTDHLIPLIQYNVKRASHTNLAILAITSLVCVGSPYKTMPLFPYPRALPESLAPTSLQLTTLHPPWIDILPSPRMRDNAIRAIGQFSQADYCATFSGGRTGLSRLDDGNKSLASHKR
ncbi:uncharacterized protein VDAG_05413 [Verticillium dahliae VdLs.17]|uniref:Uncharacterized protein n=1 Tax=Verticillium dahliae (strain VdLs.17 / ATCC MYA-4575 / FGSC 10137) TaxID=498257 RepID=G2X5A8_VERDV|nr:uncharacterized protein VDAG_05413 [Verticillium dahliae VdLs.17]EGY14249.1 hypothetical protein VDAG_05413 [Verticillium dahliae VdLs.17]